MKITKTIAAVAAVICAAIAFVAVSCTDINGITVNGNHKEINVISANIKTNVSEAGSDGSLKLDFEFYLKRGVSEIAVNNFDMKINGNPAAFRIFRKFDNGVAKELGGSELIGKTDGTINLSVESFEFSLKDGGGYSFEFLYNGAKLLNYKKK